jgi:putative flippase GtrA
MKYIVSGFTAVVLHLLVLTFLVEAAKVNKIMATSAGFCIGSVVNYLLQYYWVFCSDQHHQKAFVFYFSFAIIMLVINARIFEFFLNTLNLHYLLSQCMATGIVFILNYHCNLFITFRQSRRKS